ncbi:hypothetical protein [Jeotgalibacillus proteolyticus]|uniref:Uncharacterized protein n=1 Tax=Jeotgalibacillus proteolyticus TaxID=2082395 RepID=A0A2S5G746_9BACL|nr:hypothetical protein [Jeotgalibacillus proteolyticus]PPA68674.1 hypothetical protein C4B60_19065 [Jeotgalibacillus proteolyticus]PPA68751.1 hypothetical protein C4B60_19495 [Jeotgalibacillus proteolyticus]
MKRVSFSLVPGQVEQYKALVDASLQSRILRNYILNEYQLPEDLRDINIGDRQGLKPLPFHFDEFTDERVNELVKHIQKHGCKANRSTLMSHILTQLIQKLSLQSQGLPKDRVMRHSSFYFERGTRELIEKFIPFRDRNAMIERFILEDYQPRKQNPILFDKPVEPEAMRISIAAEAFDKLDQKVSEIGTKAVTRTSLMRDVIEQLIEKLSNSDARKLIAEVRLKHALDDYKSRFGEDVLKEQLQQYTIKGEGS